MKKLLAIILCITMGTMLSLNGQPPQLPQPLPQPIPIPLPIPIPIPTPLPIPPSDAPDCHQAVAGVTYEVSPGEVTICWEDNGSSHYNILFRKVGAITPTFINPQGASCYTITGLEDCEEYEFGIRNVCPAIPFNKRYFTGWIGLSSACCTEPVQNITIEQEGNSVTICWDDSGADSYAVIVGSAGSFPSFYNAGSNTCITIDNLEPCTNYRYRVRSSCTVAGEVVQSNSKVAKFSTNCCDGAVENITVDISDNEATICWDHNGSDSYTAFYSLPGSPFNTSVAVPAGESCVNISDLQFCQDYEVYIQNSCVLNGTTTNYESAAIDFTTECCDSPVTGLEVNIDGNSVTVCWDHNGSDTYTAFYGAPGSPFNIPVAVPSGQSCVTISDLKFCEDYEVYIQNSCELNGITTSYQSAAIGFTTECCSGAVSDDITFEVNGNSLTVCWEGNGSEYYNLAYGPAGSTAHPFTPNSLATCATIDGLDFCTDYEFFVRNYCIDEFGFGQHYHSTITQFSTECCNAPVENVTTEFVDNSVTICWDDNLSSSYSVAFGEVGGSNNMIQAGTNTCVTIDDLDLCTDYQFIVRNICTLNGGTSLYVTQTMSFSTDCCNSPVSGITTMLNDDSVTICWDDNLSSSYSVAFGEVGGSSNMIQAGTNTCVTIDDLDVCMDYEFQIRNICDTGDGLTLNFSDWIGFSSNCCEGPVDVGSIVVEDVSHTEATISFDENASTTYGVIYSIAGTGVGTGVTSTSSPITIVGLDECTEYEFYIVNWCGDEVHLTETLNFTTPNMQGLACLKLTNPSGPGGTDVGSLPIAPTRTLNELNPKANELTDVLEEEVKLNLYPNPIAAHDILNINIESAGFKPLVIRLFNIQGQLIDEELLEVETRSEASHIQYQLPENIDAGMHIVNLTDAHGKTVVHKFVVDQ